MKCHLRLYCIHRPYIQISLSNARWRKHTHRTVPNESLQGIVCNETSPLRKIVTQSNIWGKNNSRLKHLLWPSSNEGVQYWCGMPYNISLWLEYQSREGLNFIDTTAIVTDYLATQSPVPTTVFDLCSRVGQIVPFWNQHLVILFDIATSLIVLQLDTKLKSAKIVALYGNAVMV